MISVGDTVVALPWPRGTHGLMPGWKIGMDKRVGTQGTVINIVYDIEIPRVEIRFEGQRMRRWWRLDSVVLVTQPEGFDSWEEDEHDAHT